MNRRTFLLSVTVAPVVAALAACGDSSKVSVATDPGTTPATTPATTPSTTPGTTPATTPDTTPTTTQTGIAHPTRADDLVLALAYEGGFVAPNYLFARLPQLLVSGDGRVFTEGAVPAIYPGPLLPTILVRSITEDGIQILLGVANAAGLLAAPGDYTGGTRVADAANTVLTINAQGGSFVHSAYALGIDTAETPARQRLLDAVNTLSDLDKTVGAAELGPNETFVATAYRLRAAVADPSVMAGGQEPAPTIVDWPAGAGISLADASDCGRVDAAAIGSLFTDAKQNTYFKEGVVVYQLSVRGVLPGDPAC